MEKSEKVKKLQQHLKRVKQFCNQTIAFRLEMRQFDNKVVL